VIACAGSDYSSMLLLFSEISKCSGCSSNFKAADGLEIFSFQEDIGVVLL